MWLASADDLARMEEVPLVVDDKGYTRESAGGKPVRCAMAWKDLPGFEDYLVNRLTSGR